MTIEKTEESFFTLEFDQPVKYRPILDKKEETRRLQEDQIEGDQLLNLKELEKVNSQNRVDEIFKFSYEPSFTTSSLLEIEDKSQVMSWSINVIDSTKF